jgi:glycosyltransferase involved in cell wall biosynthesis
MVGKTRGKRVILNYRGGDAARFFQYWGWLVGPLLRMADVVTVPSCFLKDLICARLGINVLVVNNIIDTSLFGYRERITLQPRIIVARQLEPIYDIEAVLKAFRDVQKRYYNACLAVVGTGSQSEFLRNMAVNWGLRNVEFLGHVPHEDLPAIYDKYDIFLNASRVDNFPGALLEASAAGLAVVSTAVGGIPFMYENEKDALLVPPGEWEALARATAVVIESPGLARQLIQAGMSLVQSCEWAAVRQNIYLSYGVSYTDQQVVASGGGASTGETWQTS